MKNRKFADYISLALKGVGMGAANVIPGVSGGTIALITGIFEELIDSIKSFNLKALQLLIKGRFKEFALQVNLYFLVAVGIGIVLSILSLAKLLEYLFANFPVYVWSFFIGLIVASVYFVGRTVTKWSIVVIATFIVGTAIAAAIAFLSPASENEGFIYLVICGVAAICSMILPGLSGSFVLVLMGNYELVVIKAVTQFRFDILFPVIIGAAIGLVMFSHFLSWVYKKYRNETIAILTGFILGSLAILWPWQTPVYKNDAFGQIIYKSANEPIIIGYDRFMPNSFNKEVLISIILVVVGIALIWIIEKFAATAQKDN